MGVGKGVADLLVEEAIVIKANAPQVDQDKGKVVVEEKVEVDVDRNAYKTDQSISA